VLGCGLLAVLVAVIALVVTLRPVGWSLSALPRVDSKTGMGAAARALDPGFRTVHPGAYDGQFYWGIANDPLATGTLHHAFDKASYRYGHPLYGWLGWLFSAGRARAVPAALAAVGLASLFAAAAAAVVLGLGRGRSGWAGLFVALNPGLISSAVNDLAEPLAAALLLGAFVALVRGRWAPAWACLALLPLAKEPLIVVPLAVVAWELLQGRRRLAAGIATAVTPALLWWTYARIHLGAWFVSGDSALGPPLSGWRSAILHHGKSGNIGLAVLAAFLVLLVLAGLRAVRVRGPVELSYLALGALALCLAPNATVAFTTAMRNTAFLLVLVPFVIAAPPLLPRSRTST
jgi:uncharacterized membrane protein (UPF0136 family)